MPRLIGPDEASREVKVIVGRLFRSKAGRPAQLWADAAATVPADVLNPDGSAIPPQQPPGNGGRAAAPTVTVDSSSMLPLMQFPPDVDVVYATCDGGPAWPVYARTDDRIDAAGAALAQATVDATAKAAAAQAAATTAGVALPQRVDEIRRGKGGTLGTAGKGVVSIRFDHQLDPLRTVVWPLMAARALPGSVGVVTRSVGNPAAPYEPTTTTWAQLRAMMAQGLEVWSHSCTHGNGSSLADEIVNSKAEIEAQGIRVMGWQQPGAPATYGAAHTSIAAMDTEAGRLIRATYGLYESSILGTNRRILPTHGVWGHDHVTVDTMSYATVKAAVDFAIAMRTGVQLMLHSAVVGTGGNISLADLTQVLDYLADRREAGALEVLTATGLAFADPSHSRRLDLVADGDFETATTAVLGYGWSQNTAGSWTIQTDGGKTGSRYLRIPSTGTRCISATGQQVNLGLDGFSFIFDGWTRTTEATAGTEWRVRIRDSPTNTVLLDVHGPLTQSSSWTHVRVPFTIPVGVSILAVEVGRWSGGSVDWDDVHAYAV